MSRVTLTSAALAANLLLMTGPAWSAGGDTCVSATVITAVPYTDLGNTCSLNNWYDEHCPDHSTSSEAVYAYTPTSSQCVDVSLCGGTVFDSKLYVYASDAGGCPATGSDDTGLQIACNDDACPTPGGLVSEITGLTLTGGVTYAFVVDGSSGECGDYQIIIAPCSSTSCTTDEDCDDDVFCNGPEYCDTSFVCQPGTPPDCDDADPCTDDACDQLVDACVNTPVPGCCTVDTDCDDGVFCNGSESCGTGFVCQPGTPPDCDDSDPCTDDTCDPEVDACIATPIPDCCTTDTECDDGNPCTSNVCDVNVCEYPPIPGTACGNPSSTACTDPDTCDAAGACQPNHASDGTPCDDGDVCTDDDACSSGSCTGYPNLLCETCAQGGQPEDPVNQLSFQGLLTDVGGNPLQSPVDLSFQLYDLAGYPVGTPIDLTSVPISNGIVSTELPIQDGVLDGTGRTLGVSVNGGTELSPRIPLTSAPQSFRVGCVESQEVVSHVALGGSSESGSLDLYNASGELVFTLDIDSATGAPSWTMYSTSQGARAPMPAIVAVADVPHADVCDGGAEEIFLNSDGAETIVLRAEQCRGLGDVGAYVTMSDGVNSTIALDADDVVGGGALMHLSNSAGRETVTLDADVSNSAQLTLWRQDSATVIRGITLDAESGHGAHIGVFNEDGGKTVRINGSSGGLTSGDGGIEIRNRDNEKTIALYGGDITGGGSGEIRLYNSDSRIIPTIKLSAADFGGMGKITTEVLAVTGGSDLSEQFDIEGCASDVKPGMVVSIDPEHPGRLVISSRAYDRRVAGVISGAAGLAPGMLMGQSGSVADGEHPVALTGRVYCWADASNGSIQAGDLLTTSSTAGHAIKVTDYDAAQGAIVGKAMTSLEEGRGLILVLVTLQ
ncbi:MAG: hypothetical protein JSU63_03550 [Phycisphaerales bacterium]|nr:MAG: hypothetical protein JSU63_03550 [Phycisphaerales bacterium]